MDGQRTMLSEYPKKKKDQKNNAESSIEPLLQNHTLALVVDFSIAGHKLYKPLFQLKF